MIVKQCLFCHKDFKAAKKTTKYCCRSCQSFHLGQLYGKQRAEKRKNGVTLKCEHCQSEYYVPKYRIDLTKYCSRVCLGYANPERAEKARNNSPIMRRAGLSKPKKYKVLDGKFVSEKCSATNCLPPQIPKLFFLICSKPYFSHNFKYKGVVVKSVELSKRNFFVL